jgi:DNA-binding transcriptional ArsR family regulator
MLGFYKSRKKYKSCKDYKGSKRRRPVVENRKPNPFKPTAGADPPLIVGREEYLDEFVESIEDGPGAPGRLTLFIGPRGVGKTVMLNAVAQRVQDDYQWMTIHEAATSGVLERLTAQAVGLANELRPVARRIAGVNIASVGGITLVPPDAPPELSLRKALTDTVGLLEARGTGLLITVDEVHASSVDDMRQFATVVQHLIRENREIAVVMAGLPTGFNTLLSDNPSTFLRRANRFQLGDVPLPEVAQALRATIEDNGRTIADDALALATQTTGGYPFMIQLVGYHTWRRATGDTIDIAAAQAGAAAATARLGRLVHETALKDLSDVDRAFLAAMAQDSGPSTFAAISERMGKTASYLSVYRSRLLDAGIIRSDRRGTLDFALPHLREYLQTGAQVFGNWGAGADLEISPPEPPIAVVPAVAAALISGPEQPQTPPQGEAPGM